MRTRWLLVFALVLPAAGCKHPETGKPPGNLKAFNANTALPGVRAFVGPDAELLKISGRHVRSDGTIDVYAAYNPGITYEFLRPAAENKDVPVGAGRGSGWEHVTVRISKPGHVEVTTNNSSVTYKQLGMNRSFRSARGSDRKNVVGDPNCTFRQLWEKAIAQKVTPDGVARIEYDKDGYEFRISEIDVWLEFDHTCAMTKSRVAPAESTN